MQCLVVSGALYNGQRDQRIVAEVVGQQLEAAGGVLIDLGPVGVAVADIPIAVSLGLVRRLGGTSGCSTA